MKTWNQINCYELGLILKTKTKDKKWVKRTSYDSITFSKPYESESQPSQMVFLQWELNPCGVLNFWDKNASNKFGSN
jgi:hypothetical protein